MSKTTNYNAKLLDSTMAKSTGSNVSSQCVCVQDFEDYAKKYLPKNAFDYYVSGANDMQTLRENVDAFKRLRIVPRVMRDVSTIDMSTTVLGQPIGTPVCVAPSAMQKMAHPDGEVATARACAKVQNCLILSSLSSTSIEDVAKENGNGLRWFQLYIYKDREVTRRLVQRAEASGYKAIVLTVDTPLMGSREPDMRNRFQLPSHLTLANFADIGKSHSTIQSTSTSGLAEYASSLFDQTISWEDIRWLKSITRLPIVAKGVLSSKDAEMAVNAGCDGILVSNHGARQLDGVPATIEVLSEVVKAVQGRAEVYLDGGVRRGTDVFKALALGARAVFIGRPALWGLAQGGQEGLDAVLECLNSELHKAMMFSGTISLKDITPDYLRHENYFRKSML